MRKMFSRYFQTSASIPSELASSGAAGISSVEEDRCAGEFDSDRCPRHPRNDGECPHSWICDKLKEWENKNKVSEMEMNDRVKHGESAINGKKNN